MKEEVSYLDNTVVYKITITDKEYNDFKHYASEDDIAAYNLYFPEKSATWHHLRKLGIICNWLEK